MKTKTHGLHSMDMNNALKLIANEGFREMAKDNLRVISGKANVGHIVIDGNGDVLQVAVAWALVIDPDNNATREVAVRRLGDVIGSALTAAYGNT